MSIIESELISADAQKTEHGETLQSLTDDKNFQKKTVLVNVQQALAFGTLWSIAEENDIIFLRNWLKNNADWLLSVGGKGRNDIVEVSKFKGEKEVSWGDKISNLLHR